MVCDFSEVFTNDISDLPLQCKFEFAICFIPDTSLVSMAPYKMFASELCELGKQLEELFEKKFVRPSVSQ